MSSSKDRSHLPEITPRVILLGLLLAAVMGAANVYIGLKAGMTVSASIPAAVMAMLIFKLMKTSSILEANQVQTAASAGESLAAGIIFTMPALILIGYWSDFDFWTVTGVSFTGGLLGILFMIPMRRVFVKDNEELPYPEGIACAAVLEAGEDSEDSTAAMGLVWGGLVGGLFKFFEGFLEIFKGTLEGAMTSANRIFYFGGDVSPMLVAVGFIVRLNVAALIFIGGSIGWLIGIPLLGGADAHADNLVDGAYSLWSNQVRYIGVGAMVVGGLSSIVSVRKGLVEAVRHLTGAARGDTGDDPRDRDIPGPLILGLAAICVTSVALIYQHFTGSATITAVSTVTMLVMSFFFTAVASYIVGLVGNSNSPVSGMTITAVLFTGAMLYLFDFEGQEMMVAILGVAAIVCCVACTSGDVCNDLKTGLIVGAAPRKQQTMQILGVAMASVVMAPVLTLLHTQADGGIGGRELAAPQASLFASLAKGFAGEGTLPWNLIGIGAAIGVVILFIDGFLRRSGSAFRAHLMPIAVGIYLPFGLATPILIGGLMAHFLSKGTKDSEEIERKLQGGVIFSSGVIAGEALMGVGLAGLAALGVESLGFHVPYKDLITGFAAIGVLIIFWRIARRTSEAPVS